MTFRELASFDVVHAELEWPWLSFAADRALVAFASSASTIATRRLEGEHVVDGPSFALPADLGLASGTGLTKLSVSTDRDGVIAAGGIAAGASVIAIVGVSGERKRVGLDAILGEAHELRAIAFDRTGRRVWLSAENSTETVTALVEAASLAVVGMVRTAAFPRPALHEIHLHPHDDAVIVLAACGEEGTFARVVGFAGDEVSAVPSELDSGAVAAGFVGFSAACARVHLAEADELRTHAWPTLHELSSIPLADDFVSAFSGAVLDGAIFVDGLYGETEEDAVMLFDRAAIHGVVLPPPAPLGMWAGRLGVDAIVTVEAKGEPVRARVLLRSKDTTKLLSS